jgi:Ca2+-binding RTX toxin-like protein
VAHSVVLAAVVVAGWVALTAAPASGASISQNASGCNPGPCTDSNLLYVGGSSENNNVQVSVSGGTYTFLEMGPGVTITGFYSICSRVSDTQVTCPTTMPDGRPLDVDAILQGGDDQIDMRTHRPSRIEGGEGSDLIKGSSANDEITGDPLFGSAGPFGADFIDGRGGADFMSGGPATNDTVSYSSRSTAVDVSLDDFANDGGFGEGDNVRADVEIVRGTDAGDDLTGNNSANTLVGLGGFDVLTGLGGPDTLEGGDTNDHLEGGFGNDSLLGQGGADTMLGGWDSDYLDGGTEDDDLFGSFGADDMYGGAGTDDVDYAGFTAPLTVTAHDDAPNDGFAGELDNVHSDIERIFGGDGNDRLEVSFNGGEAWGRGGNDTLLGHNPDDRLEGENGNDTLDGRWGADVMNGGAGTDTVDYTDHWYEDEFGSYGVVSNPNGSADDGNVWIDYGATGTRDNVGADIENVIGSSAADGLIGTTDANRLMGRGGDDSLDGAAAADVLLGGADNDYLRGEAGDDTLDGAGGADVMDGGDDVDIATYASRSADLVVRLDDVANDGETAINEGDNVTMTTENVRGGQGADLLVGSGLANELFGEGGDDTLSARLGADTVNGQGGVDTMSYSDRTTPVAVNLDGRRNDGADPNGSGSSTATEEGDLDLNMENATGGSDNDILRAVTANGVANLLRGLDGDDTLFSREGTSTIDTLQCGPGTGDGFRMDPSDVQSACEVALP